MTGGRVETGRKKVPDVTLTFALWHAIIHVFINESDAEAEGNAGMSIMQSAARRRARIRRAALSGAVLAVAACLFAGCRGIPDGFVGGETLTPEKLRELYLRIPWSRIPNRPSQIPSWRHMRAGSTGWRVGRLRTPTGTAIISTARRMSAAAVRQMPWRLARRRFAPPAGDT